MKVSFNDEPGMFVLSGAPKELCIGPRTFDEDMLVNTILDAEKSVCISVMDFAPVSLYRGQWNSETHKYMVGDKIASPVWWPALIDALLHSVCTKQVHGRLLISEWAHTSEFVGAYLDALAAMAQAAFAKHSMTAGKLEIRRFRVPGWRSTGAWTDDATPRYPGHTRVNHTKYIVTDKRINIGTSNMTWDYFNGTAGASFNATHPSLVSKLQEIFDRDWVSDYALPIHS
jgi:phospholipase D3/4